MRFFVVAITFTTLTLTILGSVSSFSSVANAAPPPPATLAYQGRILKADGSPLVGSIPFRIQVRSPSDTNCLMYEEERVVTISPDARGSFAFEINGAGRTRTDAGLYPFEEIFNNRGLFSYSASDCGTGTSFTPDSTSTRSVVVMFDTGGGSWEALPAMATAFVPQALDSMHVGGYGSGDLLRVDRTSSQVVNAFTFTDYTKLVDLISGKLMGSALPILTSGQVLGSNGSGGWQGVTPLTAASIPNCATGEYLRGSSGTLVCASVTSSGTALTSLNGQTGTSQTLAVGTSGTAPAFSSASNTHTLNIPLASTASVTAGLLSNTDYVSFASRQPAGNYVTAMTGDVTTSAFSSGSVTATIANNAVTDAKIASVGVDKITSGAGKYLTYAPDGTACTNGQILKWSTTNTRWECGADAGIGSEIDPTVQAFAKNAPSADFATPSGTLTLATVGTAKGGTGLTTTGTANQFLSMNTAATGLEYKTITAGAGVTVTPGAGTLTIAATGTGGISSLGGQSGATQTFAVGTTGTAPGFNSASNTHTLNIPMASTASVTAGLLSNTDYASFASRQPAGNYVTAMTGDVTTSAFSSGSVTATIANNAVTDAKIAGVGVDKITSGTGKYLTYAPNGTSCANGETLKWNNTSSRWECGPDSGLTTESDPTVQAFAKGAPSADFTTPSGTLTLGTVGTAKGGTGLTAIGSASQILGVNTGATGLEYKTLTAGSGVTITPGAGTLTIASTATGGITSLGGQSGATQTFAVGATGTAPGFNSASNTHTLNIPMASTASVTAGLLSNTDYTAFNAKQPAGNYVTAMTGDVTTSAFSSGSVTATIANNAITDAKVASVGVDKITSATGKYLTYSPNGTACTNGQVLKWNTASTRWDCGTDNGVATETDPTVQAFSKNAPSADFTTPSGVLTLGTVGTAKGGTGLTTAGTANQFLSMNTGATGLEYKTITAGTGVTITPSAGTLTIASTVTGGITSLGGQSGTTQTFANGTAGTAPAFSSASNTHTLNIPMASTASVTAGLLSNTDYAAFNAKQAAGNYVTAMTGDVTTSAFSAGSVTATIANNAVTDVKIASVGVDKITSATGKYLTYSPNGTACTNGQVLKWNTASTRWDCGTDNGVGTETDPTVQAFAKAAPSADFTTPSGTLTLGTVGTAKGGTGLTSLGTANQILGVNTGATGLEYKTITAGTGVTITPSAGTVTIAATGSGGTVTSVGVSVPAYMTSSGGPVTSSGTIALGFGTQSANTVFAGPTSGSAAPGFRTLNIGDIKSTNTGNFFNASGACPSGQVLSYSSVSDQISCAAFTVSSSQVSTALGYTPVNKAGDTMTGNLVLPSGGLQVGTSDLVATGGKVGIGTATPGDMLHLYGDFDNNVGLSLANPHSTSNASAGINFYNDSGNIGWLFAGSSVFSDSTSANRLILGAGSSGGGISLVANSPADIRLVTNGSGERLRVTNGGYIGINSQSPQTTLDVNGAIVTTAPNVTSGTTVDFIGGNLQYTSQSCGAFTLNNMKNGGSYTLAIQGTSNASACSFTAYTGSGSGALTVKMPPDHQVPISGKHTLYSFIVLGSFVYVSWVPGY